MTDPYGTLPAMRSGLEKAPQERPRRGKIPRTISAAAHTSATGVWVFAVCLAIFFAIIDTLQGNITGHGLLLTLLLLVGLGPILAVVGPVSAVMAVGGLVMTIGFGVAHRRRGVPDPKLRPALLHLAFAWGVLAAEIPMLLLMASE